MTIPASVSFSDDFIGVGLQPAWHPEGDVSMSSYGVDGLVQLASASSSTPARLRLGEDQNQISTLPLGIHNWAAPNGVTLEARIVINSLDCEVTFGLVGVGDGNTPAADFVGLWLPNATGWTLQASNVGAGGVLVNQPSTFIHTPGGYFDFEIGLAPAGGTISANGSVIASVTNTSAIPLAPMFVEFQIWGTATNSDAAMWVDWMSITQGR